jgi:hypothetical protein
VGVTISKRVIPVAVFDTDPGEWRRDEYEKMLTEEEVGAWR